MKIAKKAISSIIKSKSNKNKCQNNSLSFENFSVVYKQDNVFMQINAKINAAHSISVFSR